MPTATYQFNSYNAGSTTWQTSPANIVDGSDTTFGRTNVNGDHILMDGNQYTSGGTGTITKVELHCSWASNGSNCVPSLVPVFGGTTDGDSHAVTTSNSAQTDSAYFDITSDTNAPGTWSWSDIAALQGKITVARSGNRIDIYYVDVRVTYTTSDASVSPSAIAATTTIPTPAVSVGRPIVAGSATNHSNAGNFNVSVPAGTQNDDLLIAINASDWDTLANTGVPTGFTALTTSGYDGGTNNVHVAVGYRIASSEPANYSFPGGTSSDTAGILIRITGADSTPVIAQVAPTAVTAGTGTVTAPTPTPDSSSDLIIVAVATDGDQGSGALTWTWDASCSEIAEVQSTLYTVLTSAASDSTGTYTATSSTGTHDKGGAIAISIKAAGSPDAAVTPAVVAATATIGGGSAFTPDAQVNATVVSATATIPGPSISTSKFIASIDGTNLCLLDSSGDPILLRGDTNWALPFNAGAYTHTYQEDIDHYVSTRSSEGYNAILIAALGSTQNGGPADTGANENGDLPFVGTNFGSLTSAYWTRVDYLVTACENAGITVLFDPIYSYDMDNGALHTATSTDYGNYGTAIGTRYKDYPNIIWWFGGDYFDTSNTLLDAFVTGLTGAGDSHLITIENDPESTSRHDISPTATLNWGTSNADFNVVYSYNASYDGTEFAWDEASPIAVVHGDGHYLSDGSDTALFLRNWAWWILSSGSRGINAGSEGIWNWNSGSYASTTTETFLTTTLPAICDVFTSFTGWHKLRPDTSSALVTAGRGTHISHLASGGGATAYSGGNSYVTASITSDGTLAVIYIPASTTITIDESQMAAGYTANWVDPIDGTTTSATTGTTYNSSTPGTNSAGGSDWVLVLQGTATQDAAITATAVAATATIPAPTITAVRSASVTPSAVAASAAIPSVTASTGSTASPSAISANATIPSPTESAGSTTTPSVVSAAVTIPAVTPSTSAIQSPSAVAAAATIPTPTVQTSGSASVTPAVVAATATIPSAVLSTGAGVTPSVIDATANIPAISFSSSVDVAPSVVAGTSNVPTPNVVFSTNVLASVVAAAATIPVHTVETSGSASVHPSVVAASATIPAPTVDFGTTVIPSAVSATATIPSIGIIIGTVVTPNVISAAATIPAATVNTGSSASVSPSAIAAMATIPTPAVSAPASANVTPSVVAASATIPAPGASGSSTVTASVVALSASLPAPTISLSVSIQPSAVSASATIPQPSISSQAGASITPGVVAATAAIPAPTTAVSVSIQPSVISAAATIPAPAESTGSTASPVAISAVVNFPEPTLFNKTGILSVSGGSTDSSTSTGSNTASIQISGSTTGRI